MIDDNSGFYEALAFANDSGELMHYGTPRHSGRYPWGSGGDPYQNHKGFLAYSADLRKQGMSPKEIATAFGLDSTTELRAKTSIASNAVRAYEIARVHELKRTGMSNPAIAKELGLKNESTVRGYLNPALAVRNEVLINTANHLKGLVEQHKYIDIGAGAEHYLNGISADKKRVAVKMLEEEGYKTFGLKVLQQGTGRETEVKILAAPGVRFPEVVANQDKIGTVTGWSEDGGLTIKTPKPPTSVSSKRIEVRYGSEGGARKDGLIELRPGVKELSLGEAKYAQVRIAVDGTHYLKGMAVYSDSLPEGVDVRFNTNKDAPENGDKLKAMKALKDDPGMPFGSIVRQRDYEDASGKMKQSPINIVNEEGDWHKWSRNLSAQALSKQTPKLAREQLDVAARIREDELNEIKSLTNPAVKQKLLDEFADGADAAAVHLKAAGLPRTRSQVLIPVDTLKDHEIYAPNYNDGEKVVLIRHPHAGTFEIPELTVNNRNREAKRIMGGAKDGIGINAAVAQRLSGADFDGDTVLVIPNNAQKVKTTAPLEKLKTFDHQREYAPYDGMKTIDGGKWNGETGKVEFPPGKKSNGKYMQVQMGEVSNLITDMDLRGASRNEMARAVAHSMVVIDSLKHSLNYAQSARDNDIAGLRADYQNSARGGASTLISRAKGDVKDERARRPQRKKELFRIESDGTKVYEETVGPIDPETGEKLYRLKDGYVDKAGVTRYPMSRESKMEFTNDAFTLSSGTVMEAVYATHANRMKGLANEARRERLATPNMVQNPSAKRVYSEVVKGLNLKLKTAEMNAPLERKAQLVAGVNIRLKTDAHPEMEKSDLKKLRSVELERARLRLDAKKVRVRFEPEEWAAVQAGAVSHNMLEKMLANADMDQVRELATPRAKIVMTPAKVSQARLMLDRGYTAAQVAEKLNVSTSTIYNALDA